MNDSIGFRYRTLTLVHESGQTDVFVSSTPPSIPIDDANATAYLQISGEWKRGYFVCDLTKEAGDWKLPVEWEDNQLLYVPALDDKSILNALKYLLDKEQYNEALEDSIAPDKLLVGIDAISPNLQNEDSVKKQMQQIRLNVFNSLTLLKLTGKGKTRKELRDSLLLVVDEVLDQNSF